MIFCWANWLEYSTPACEAALLTATVKIVYLPTEWVLQLSLTSLIKLTHCAPETVIAYDSNISQIKALPHKYYSYFWEAQRIVSDTKDHTHTHTHADRTRTHAHTASTEQLVNRLWKRKRGKEGFSSFAMWLFWVISQTNSKVVYKAARQMSGCLNGLRITESIIQSAYACAVEHSFIT